MSVSWVLSVRILHIHMHESTKSDYPSTAPITGWLVVHMTSQLLQEYIAKPKCTFLWHEFPPNPA